jgi:hypothetical protein
MARDDFMYERRREGLPVVPVGIAAVMGVAQGLIASYDVDSWATDAANTAKVPGQAPPLSFDKSKTLWLDLGAVGLGAIGLFADWHEDISEPLLGAGAFGLGQTLAFNMVQQGKTAPANPQAMRGARVGEPAVPTARVPVRQLPEPPAFLREEAAGIL